MNQIAWAIAAVLAISVISFYTAQANIEDSKQTAFMMKACVDAGGAWAIDWRSRPSCSRPGAFQ